MIKKSNFKKILATASAFAFVAGVSTNALGADGDKFSRPATNNATFGKGTTDFYNGGGGAAIFSDGFNFINAMVDDKGGADLATETSAKNINSFNVYGHDGKTLKIDVEGGSLGSVYNIITQAAEDQVAAVNPANAAAGTNLGSLLKLQFGGNHTETLTGTGGIINGFDIPSYDYSALGEINFDNKDAKLNIKADTGQSITLANATVVNGDGGASVLDVDTDLVVKSETFASIRKFDIDSGKRLTFDVSAGITRTVNSTYQFGDADSTLEFKIDTSAADRTITLSSNVKTSTDRGTIIVNNTGVGSVNITDTSLATTIGESNSNRLAKLQIEGKGDINFGDGLRVFAKDALINNTATTAFEAVYDAGDNSSLKFGDIGTVKFKGTANIALVDFAGKNATIEIVGDKTLTGTIKADAGNATIAGTLRFTGAGGGGVANTANTAGTLTLIEVATNDGVAVSVGGANGAKATTLKMNGANGDSLAQLDATFTGNVSFNSEDAYGDTVHLGTAAAAVIEGSVATANNKKGNILVNSYGATITGDIGTVDAALNDVHANAGTLILTGTNSVGHEYYSKTFSFTGTDGQITVNKDGGHLIAGGNANGVGFVATADNDGAIVFKQGGEITGVIGHKGSHAIGLVEANCANKVVTVGAGDHHVKKFEAIAGAGFKFANVANTTGGIDASGAGGGAGTTLEFEGKSKVTGAVGATNPFESITVSSTNAADIVEFEDASIRATDLKIAGAGGVKFSKAGAGAVFSGKITVKNDGTVDFSTANQTGKSDGIDIAGAGIVKFAGKLEMTANNGIVMKHNDATLRVYGADDTSARTITGAITANAADNGKIEIAADVASNTVEFAGAIGDTDGDKRVGSLTLSKDVTSEVTLSEDTHIGTVHFNDSEATLKLANKAYKFNEVKTEVDSKNKLLTNGNATISASDGKALNIGAPDKKLESLTFAANSDELTLGKGVNAYFATIGDKVNHGILKLVGNNIIAGDTMDTKSLRSIEIGAANEASIVTIQGHLKAAGDITLKSDTATLVLESSIKADNINPSKDGTGALKLANNDTDSTITGNVGGAGVAFGKIEFAGTKGVTFAGDVTAQENSKIEFSSAPAATVKFSGKANDFGKAEFIGNEDATHTIDFGSNDITLEKASAEATSKQLNFKVDAGKTITIQTAKSAGLNITGGKLNMNLEGAVINTAGASGGTNLPEIKFTKSGTITAGTYAKDLTILDDQVASLGGTINLSGNDGFKLDAGNSAVEFLDNAIIDSTIKAAGTNFGVVTFKGNTTINKAIGESSTAKVRTVIFSDKAGDKAKLYANINATNFNTKKGNIYVGRDVTINSGTINTSSTIFDLNENILSFNGGGAMTITGDNTINASVTNVSQKGEVEGGKISVGSGYRINYQNAKFTIVIDDADDGRPVGGASRTYTLLKHNSDYDVLGKDQIVGLRGKHLMTSWERDRIYTSGIRLVQKDNAKDVMQKALEEVGFLNETSSINTDSLALAAPGSQGYRLVETMAKVIEQKDGTSKKSDLEKISVDLENKTAGTEVIANIANGFSAGSLSRLDTIQTQVAAAAGDEDYKYGSWLNPFFTMSDQKSRDVLTAYKDKSLGTSIGIDTKLANDIVLGASFGIGNTEVKYKDVKSGDKTDVESYAFSIYGIKQISDYWTLSSVITSAFNTIKNDTKKVSGAGTRESVEGNYKAMSFNGELLATYSQDMGGVVVSPMGGLRYTKVNSSGYKETGSTNGQNLDISAKDYQRLEAIAGIKLYVPDIDVNGLPLTPDFHASVNYDTLGKAQKQDVTLDGAGMLSSATYKAARANYNVGVGVKAEYDFWEYGLGYDMQISDKRLGHQGNFKLRVNF